MTLTRTRSRLRSILWTLGSVLLVGCSGAGAALEPGLVGTWRASGTTMTGSMQRTGSFLLRIEHDGRYVLVSQGGTDFVVDSGRYVEARGGGYVRAAASGLEDRGRYALRGDELRFTSFYGELTARRAPADAGEPMLTRVATLLRIPTRNQIAHWTSRAAQYAELWAPDARLEYVSMSGFDERGLLSPTSTASIGFYSPARGRLLLLSPMRNGAGMTMSLGSSGSFQPAARGIPVPIVDFAMLVNRQRDAGVSARYAAAKLGWYGEGRAPPRLLWLATLDRGAGFERHCLDAATVQIVDCRRYAGDPEAELAALEKRARAAWAEMQQRWSSGDSSSGNLSYVPPSDFDRCGARGGSFNGVGCYESSGAEIRGY